jgi:HEAT repeat protein
MMRPAALIPLLMALCWAALAARPVAQSGSALPATLPEAIGRLGSLDYPTRMNAARFVRRAPATEAANALLAVIASGTDQFVRYRALVLLTGFADRRTADTVRAVLGDRNDRLREVAYRWLAARPREEPGLRLLDALQMEQAEFVRPALVRALAARAADPAVQRALVAEVSRGQDFFRLAVIDALGEFGAVYAREALEAVARVEGPLQDDAVLALGRIGDRRAVSVIEELNPPQEVVPAVQAALCLLGADCETRVRAVADLLTVSTARPEVARAAVTALSVAAAEGVDPALAVLAELATTSRVQDLGRIGFGGAALRNPSRMIEWLKAAPATRQGELIEVLKVAFERFEDDFPEEQFFAEVRAAYWASPDGSAERGLMAALIQALEF